MVQLQAGARMLVRLAHEAARDHQTMPTTLLQGYWAARSATNAICPPTS
jgi:hypothetical protein